VNQSAAFQSEFKVAISTSAATDGDVLEALHFGLIVATGMPRTGARSNAP
jgi:hypothetical protein